jgi:hypothetical protein
MPDYPPSICGNSPLGGPITNPRTSVVIVDRYKPGEKAAMADVRWPNGTTVKVGFLNRADEYGKLLRDRVRELAQTWSQFANIKFEFVEGKTRDITINFSADVAPAGTYSSQLGTQSCIFSGRDEPSMHLVFDDRNPANTDDEFRRVILHEFGHALGLIHEHARPDGHLVWDESALREYYVTLTDGNWDWDTIQDQVMKLYDQKLVDSTTFDPQSIMMYRFPAGLAKYADGRPFETDWNRQLSPMDRDFIGKMYPIRM